MPINFDLLKEQGDELADQVIASYLGSGVNQQKVLDLFDSLRKNRDPVPADLPAALKDYFTQTSSMPAWADQAKIRAGQKIFALYGPQILMLLGCKSLPMAYSVPNGARVLVMTGRLSAGKDGNLDHLTRRITETSQFVLDVLGPDSMSASGSGVRSAQKVRLIHAAIRYYLGQGNVWQKEWGVPINQEYLLGTLMSFSALAIEGLEQLGVELSEKQKDAYMHLWNIIGHFLGIKDELLPQSFIQGRETGYAIFNRESASSEDGQKLTEALVHFYGHMIPGNLFDGMAEFMIRYFVGDKIAANLGLATDDSLEGKLEAGFTHIVFDVYNAAEKIGFIRKLTQKYSYTLLEGFVFLMNNSKSVNFDIPPSLRNSWKIRNYWETKRVLLGPLAGWRLSLQREISD